MMIRIREKPERKDMLFVLFCLVIVMVLIMIPNRFRRPTEQGSRRVRALIVETDDSGIEQYGIVRQGDQVVKARILGGPYKGEVVEAVNLIIGKLELDKVFTPGDRALIVLETRDGAITSANIIDHYRVTTEAILLGLFVILLVLFAGWTGLKAVLSFAVTGLVIWKVLLPGFLMGWNPVLLSLLLVGGLTAIIIFLIGGLTIKGLVAFLGAITGILLTCFLALVFGRAFRVHGAVRPFSETLLYTGFGHLDLSQILLAGIFLASSGAVMDVAMDISASMKEVRDHHPQIHRAQLIMSGFRVGRVVIGTMTTTLLLAYSGGYTAMLMVFLAQGVPAMNVLNLTYVSSEILHTLVGTFGLVTVAPLTAILGGLIYSSTSHVRSAEL